MKKQTLAEIFAEFAAKYQYESVDAALEPFAERILETLDEVFPNIEITDEQAETAPKYLIDFIDEQIAPEAEQLLQEWHEKALEDAAERREAYCGAY